VPGARRLFIGAPTITRSRPPAIRTVPLAVDTNRIRTCSNDDQRRGANVDIGQGRWPTAHVQRLDTRSEFRVKVGDTVIVHFKNNLAPNGHSLARHRTGQPGDGTPPTQNIVPPGGTTLKFKVTRPGVYWYHLHHHSRPTVFKEGRHLHRLSTNEETLQASGVLPPESCERLR
jgi:hypothetical protein